MKKSKIEIIPAFEKAEGFVAHEEPGVCIINSQALQGLERREVPIGTDRLLHEIPIRHMVDTAKEGADGFLHCPECGEPMDRHTLGMTTCMAFYSPPGHDHDDNHYTRVYFCKNYHGQVVALRRTCSTPGCDWKGQETSGGLKAVDQWPKGTEEPGSYA
jgi:hypothetical protein